MAHVLFVLADKEKSFVSKEGKLYFIFAYHHQILVTFFLSVNLPICFPPYIRVVYTAPIIFTMMLPTSKKKNKRITLSSGIMIRIQITPSAVHSVAYPSALRTTRLVLLILYGFVTTQSKEIIDVSLPCVILATPKHSLREIHQGKTDKQTNGRDNPQGAIKGHISVFCIIIYCDDDDNGFFVVSFFCKIRYILHYRLS